MSYRRGGPGTYPEQYDFPPVTTVHKGMMPKLGAASATLGGFVITGGGGPGSTINTDAATASLAGVLLAADFVKLAELATNFATLPICLLSNSVAQSIATGTVTALTWGTEDFDAFGFHVAAGSTLTVPVGYGGVYLAYATAGFANAAGGTRRLLALRINGTIVASAESGGASTATSFPTFGAVTITSVAAGATFDAAVFQDTGGALNTQATSRFGLVRLSKG